MKIFLIAILLIALSKWAIYRLSVVAILLYYAEHGVELPSTEIIQKYRMKTVTKWLGIKEDGNNF